MVKNLFSNRNYMDINDIITDKYHYYELSSPDINHWLKSLNQKILNSLYNDINNLKKII